MDYAEIVYKYRGEEDEAEENYKKRHKSVKTFMGEDARDFDMRAFHYRRSSIAMIDKEFLLIDTNKIFDTKQENLLSFAICAMPRVFNKYDLMKYYTLLSGKTILLAIKNDDNWYFSNNFSEGEKRFLMESTNDQIKEKGYYIEDRIKIDNKICCVYAIKKDYLDNNNSFFQKYFIYLFVIILFVFIIWIIDKIDFSNPSVSTKLRIDILLSAILPIITVSFLSHLFVNEDFNVKKTETRYRLNRLMDEIEEREYYYVPLCKYILDQFTFSEKIRNSAFIANNDNNKKEEVIEELRKELKGKCIDLNQLMKSGIDLHFTIREIDIIGKNDWVAGAVKRDWQSNYDKKNQLSDLGRVLIEITKTAYFKDYNKNLEQNTSESKRAIIVDNILKSISSFLGNLFTLKLTNFPNNLITVGVNYTTIGVYVAAINSENNPDDLEYVLYALIFFDNEFKPSVCNMRNDIVPFKDYIASGSIGDELYCFYSPNANVGDYFFYTPERETKKNNYINKREDFKTLKELGLVSSWINRSYIPVSKIVDLYGNYLIEARQGTLLSENVYVALTSEYSILKKAYSKLPLFGLVIFFSIIMIILIAQLVINDLLAPIKRLIEGAKCVAKDNYKFRTQFHRGDELGTLCDSFDKMMKSLEEKQLMNRMVSKTALKVASNLSDTESKKVDVALLYVTVPDFDFIMKSTPPYELFFKLRRHITAISEIVIDNGGDIDKIMGEKMLIAFRVGDKTSGEVAENASNVASLIETCNRLPFKVSVGVNYGQVISGYLGVGEKRDFTIIGDPVNVAARIAVFGEKLEKGNCLVSETVFNYLDNDKAELLGEVELKGKSQPMKVYQLV